MKMLLALLLLARAARAQYEPNKADGLDELTTPMHGEACGYASCLPIKPGYLNVHLVPQTHSELGHGYTFHQHFTGEDPPLPKNMINMKRILDAILTQLWSNARRRFTLSDTAYLFHWWKNRHPTVHRMMYELVRSGRLTIVGGGLGVTDEASTSYHAIIDQYTYSLRKLNETFRACARPLVAWAADVYGHSREFTSLMAQMGYDALFINPISYDEEMARMRRKALEFLWRGSDDLGPTTDMFTHNLFDGYWAPPGFCFSKLCSDPLLVTSSQLFSDIKDRVDKFIEGVLYRQSPNFETKNVMVIMGHRKAYADADVWFTNIEKLIAFTNWRAGQKRLNITLFYSSPPCYLAAVHDENPELETKQDDFFPYVHDKDSYTVGMYSSRPTFKYLIREAHIYLHIAKQIQVTADMGPHTQFFENFNWVLGVVQDHSVASGVLRHRVKDYYTVKLDAAMTSATDVISKGFTKLRSSPKHVRYYRCQFNISSCYGTRYIKYSIQVYNPLGWPVTMPVRLPVYPTNSHYNLYDHKGEEVKSVTIKLPDTILTIKNRPHADHEVVFIAANIPPVGFRSYYIEAQFFKRKITIKTGEKLDYEDNEETTNSPLWKESKEKSRYSNRREMNVLGSDTKIRQKKMIDATNSLNLQNRTSKLDSKTPERLSRAPSKDNDMKNVFIDDEVEEQMETTSEAEIMLPMLKRYTTESEREVMLPMLRNYLQKNKVLRKLDFVDSERELLSSNELETIQSNTNSEFETTYSPDIEIPFRNDSSVQDIMREPDIEVPITKRPKKPHFRAYFRATTESDIRVDTPAMPDIKITIIDPDIKVPVYKGKVKPNKKESLAIVPVRTSYVTSTMLAADWSSTTESVLVVPVRKMWERITLAPDPKIETALQDAEARMYEEIMTTTAESINVTPFDVKQSNKIPQIYPDSGNSKVLIDTDAVVDMGQREGVEQMGNEEKFAAFSKTTEEGESIENTERYRDYSRNTKEDYQIAKQQNLRKYSQMDEPMENTGSFRDNSQNTKEDEQMANEEKLQKYLQNAEKLETTTDVETTTIESTDYTSSSTDNMLGAIGPENDEVTPGTPVPTSSTSATTTVASGEKYFRVDDGSRLFIGNKYVRVNLDKRRRIASIFLRNGVRINLEILMFHYVSDDPSKFDIRTVPRRDIKPPGAYIFRPIDPYIIRSEDNYDVKIVKTDIVEEIHMTFSNWTSLQMRLYVDSPVIELHWLVGPIPTDDGLGKDVFIRYKTDLNNEGAFYTDSNGRQTIKRIKGTRATYEPVDLDPITGNLYPVTSKIYIEDLRKNIRFAVFNDRCQAGGALIDGAIDLMLHRRILTDDIGFGAFLNETENDEPIRAAGTHYLYLTKANRNKIFEKKFAKEISLAPRVLVSHHTMYTEDMRKRFYDSKNEFSALNNKLPLGVHLLSLERISPEEILVRLENYLEITDITTDGVRYVPLRDLFNNIKIIWLKETILAGNMYKDQWAPTQWRKKNKFYRRFNDYYGGGNDTLEEAVETVADELGGRGVRLAPQQIRTFIAKYKYIKT